MWGKEQLRIRDDFILLEETFFDQDMQLVKTIGTLKVGPLGGRPFPLAMRMTSLDKTDHWTCLEYSEGRFDLTLPDSLFTLSNLRNPRP